MCPAREARWWSITGDAAVVPKIAALLGDADPDVQDEARRSLQGIPGAASLQWRMNRFGR